MCATDGCFGYVKTPMHFEAIIVEQIVKLGIDTKTIADLGEMIITQLKSIPASDDCTMAARVFATPDTPVVLGDRFFNRMMHLKEAYLSRYPSDATTDYYEKQNALIRRRHELNEELILELAEYVKYNLTSAVTNPAQQSEALRTSRFTEEFKNLNRASITGYENLRNDVRDLTNAENELYNEVSEAFTNDFISYVLKQDREVPKSFRSYEASVNQLESLIDEVRRKASEYKKSFTNLNKRTGDILDELSNIESLDIRDTDYLNAYTDLFSFIRDTSVYRRGEYYSRCSSLQDKIKRQKSVLINENKNEISKRLDEFLKMHISVPDMVSEHTHFLSEKYHRLEKETHDLNRRIEEMDFSEIIDKYYEIKANDIASFLLETLSDEELASLNIKRYKDEGQQLERQLFDVTNEIDHVRDSYQSLISDLWLKYKTGYEILYNNNYENGGNV
jgi:hypothetical protein